MSFFKTLGYACPRYERCNASYCPGLGGVHLPSEKVCLFLTEIVKAGGEARVRAVLDAGLAQAVLDDARRLLSDQSPLGRAIQRASRSSSRLEQWKRAGERLKGAA